jgi:hypothetical protein
MLLFETAFSNRSVQMGYKEDNLGMPDCWLEVSLHPVGPATGQLDQGFPWFSLILEQMLSL